MPASTNMEPKVGPADGPRRVPMSPEESKTGMYSIPNLQMALEGMHQDGMVVLQGLVDVEHCDKVYTHMVGDRDRILETRHAGEKVYNQGVKSNILQCASFTKPELLFDDLYFNPFVIQVMNAQVTSLTYKIPIPILTQDRYLGERPKWVRANGNNALSGTAGLRQPVHKDPRFKHPKCPFTVVANTALVDFTEENGATEFWLGTHAFSDETCQTVATKNNVFQTKEIEQEVGAPSGPIREDLVEARRIVRPPILATMKKGDVMLRDFRTWHAGMPNSTEKDRIMVAQLWMAPWYPNYGIGMKLPISQAQFFREGEQKRKMQIVAQWATDEEVEDFQHRDNFDSAPTHYREYYDTAQANYKYPFPY